MGKPNLTLIIPTVILLMFLRSNGMQLTAQNDSRQNNSQYLLPDFVQATIKMKTGQDQKAVMNYNTVTEKMVFKQGDNLMDLINLGAIDTVFLGNRKFVTFDNVFYEVLVNAPVSLFIQHKSDLLPPGKPAAYGGTTQVSSSNYLSSVELAGGRYNLKLPDDYAVKPAPVNWIRKNSTMYRFLNERQFLKIFPEKADNIKLFIKQNKLRTENPEDLIKLINFCNELVR
jgi:hypothetical protein